MNKLFFIIESILGIMIGFIIFLNFVPVKFATVEKKSENFPDIPYNKKSNEVTFVSSSYADYLKNYNSDDTDIESLSQKNTYRYLKADVLNPSNNLYRFKCIAKDNEEKQGIKELYIQKWDIIYPIERTFPSFLIRPRSYLTIYDFDWKSIIFGKGYKVKLYPKVSFEYATSQFNIERKNFGDKK